MYNKLKDEYAYAIAGQETKDLIKRLKGHQIVVVQQLESYLNAQGIKINNVKDEDGKLRLQYDYQDGAVQQPPEGWVFALPFGRLSTEVKEQLYPDRNSDSGRIIHTDIERYKKAYNIQLAFKDACCKSIGISNSHEYRFERVDQDIVVICPRASHQGKVKKLIPADCKQISYLEYQELKERIEPTILDAEPFSYKQNVMPEPVKTWFEP